MSNLFTELKRRNVLRVGAAYLVGGWILIQIADALFPALNLPDWTTQAPMKGRNLMLSEGPRRMRTR